VPATEETATQESLLAAVVVVEAQVPWALTLKPPAPPVALKVALVAERE